MAKQFTIPFKSFYDTDCTIDIYVDGYSGAVEELKAGIMPFVVENSRSSVVSGANGLVETFFKINAISSTDLNNTALQSEEYGDIWFEYKEETVLKYKGVISPFETGSPYEGDGYYTLGIGAEIGLNELKSKELRNTDGSILEGRIRLIDVVSLALKSLTLPNTFNIKSFVSIQTFTGATEVGADTDFFSRYVDAETFKIGLNEWMSCYEALETVLSGKFDLYFDEECWVLDYPLNSLASTRNVAVYDADGVFDSRTNVTISKPEIDNTKVKRGGNEGRVFSKKNITIDHKINSIVNKITNPNFEFDGFDILNWTSTVGSLELGGYGTQSEPFYAKIGGSVYSKTTPTDTEYIESTPFDWYPVGRSDFADRELSTYYDEDEKLSFNIKGEYGSGISGARIQIIATYEKIRANQPQSTINDPTPTIIYDSKTIYYTNEGWSSEPAWYITGRGAIEEIQVSPPPLRFTSTLSYKALPYVRYDVPTPTAVSVKLRLFRGDRKKIGEATGEVGGYTYYSKFFSASASTWLLSDENKLKGGQYEYVTVKKTDRDSSVSIPISMYEKVSPFAFGSIYVSDAATTPIDGFKRLGESTVLGWLDFVASDFLRSNDVRLISLDLPFIDTFYPSQLFVYQERLFRVYDFEKDVAMDSTRVTLNEVRYSSSAVSLKISDREFTEVIKEARPQRYNELTTDDNIYNKGGRIGLKDEIDALSKINKEGEGLVFGDAIKSNAGILYLQKEGKESTNGIFWVDSLNENTDYIRPATDGFVFKSETSAFEVTLDFTELTANTRLIIPPLSGDSSLVTTETGWLLNGNALTAPKSIGSTTNFDVELIANNTPKISLFASGGVTVHSTTNFDDAVGVDGVLTLNSISNATTDTNKFLVSDSGIVKYRTGTEILSDIGAFASPSGLTTNYVTKWNGTALANSQIFDNGTNVGIGKTPSWKLDVDGIINASTYYNLNGVAVLGRDGNYATILDESSGVARNAIYIGNSSDPNNYYDNTGHNFRSRDGSANFAKINSNGIAIGSVHDNVTKYIGKTYIDTFNNLTSWIGFESSTTEDMIKFNTFLDDTFAGVAMTIRGSGRVGIMTTTPTETLDVDGTIKATGLKLPTGAVTGYVLKVTDGATGATAWQAATVGERWKGTWDASSGVAPSASPTEGDYYSVTEPGTYAGVTYPDNSYAYYNGTSWVFRPNGYTLTTASAGTLGGIRIGSGLSIDGSGIVSVPTLNQNTTGSAATLTTTRNIAMTGDVAWNVNFNGSGNVTAGGTLATVNSNVGTFAGITVNGKGLVTGATALTTLSEYGITDAYTQSQVNSSFVNLSTNQSISGQKTFHSLVTMNFGSVMENTLVANINIQKYQDGGGFHDQWNIINNRSLDAEKELRFENATTSKSLLTFYRNGVAQIFNGVIGLDSSYGDITNLLRVDSNIEYSGTLRPSNSAGSNGQFLKTTGTANVWATLGHADISNLSSYTGFDGRYFTETESDARFVALGGSYSNPIWISSLAYSKLTGLPSTFAPSAHTLDSHSNVTVSSNTSGEILKWSGSAWINNTLSEAGIQATLSGTGFVKSTAGTISYDNREFVDTTTTQSSIGGLKTFTSALTAQSLNSVSGNITADSFRTYSVTYNSVSSAMIQAGNSLYFAFVPMIHRASQYVFDRGFVKIGGNTSGMPSDIAFATERLDVDGNIKVSGVIKPDNIAPSAGQFLKGVDADNMVWASIGHADISNLSSYTGFDGRYYTGAYADTIFQPIGDYITTTTAASTYQPLLPSGTTGQFLVKDSAGSLNFMDLKIRPIGLSLERIAVGNTDHYLGEQPHFLFKDKRHIQIGRITDTTKQFNAGMFKKSNNGFIEQIGGSLSIRATDGLYLTDFASPSRPLSMLTIDAFGKLSVSSIAGGGAVQASLTTNHVGYGINNTLSSSSNFTYLSDRYLHFTGASANVNIGASGSGSAGFLESVNGNLLLQARSTFGVVVDEGYFQVDALAGTGTRMVVVDGNGKFDTQTIPSGGGSVGNIDQVLAVGNVVDNQTIIFENSTQAYLGFKDASSAVIGSLSVYTDTADYLALTSATGNGIILDSAENVLVLGDNISLGYSNTTDIISFHGMPFNFNENAQDGGSGANGNQWGSGFNQGAPVAGDRILFFFDGTRWVPSHVHTYAGAGGKTYLTID